ncbi:MAG: stage II sporulation protein P [Firmicutes bacterium HGW-Firmicutes-14]|nr:MAG: stage II sporulation protein P [Firmicutes bacterium HGW-Firmicutes-14]
MRQVRAGSIFPMVRNLSLFFAAVLLVFFAVIAGQFPDGNDPLVPALSSGYYYEKSRTVLEYISEKLGTDVLEVILKTELPALAIADKDSENISADGTRALKVCLNLLSGVRLDDPLTYLKSEIPMMEVTPVTADSFDETGIDEITEKPAPPGTRDKSPEGQAVDNRVSSLEPLIALYNTHTSETYELTDGLAHLKWKAGGVTAAAGEIKRAVEEEYGIAAVYSATLHDKAFNRSYVESEKTVCGLVKDYPDLEMVFDIHRDGSLTREQSIVDINGRTAAKILIVVGTDARAEHPGWRENLAFARKIAAKMDEMYPGLSRGITIKEGRYNQQHHPRALLIEIGSTKNTTGEAVISAGLFADVAVAVLNDLRNEE